MAGLTICEDLLSRLMTDTATGEALPLLAFTLERLATGVKRGQELSLQRYIDLGGVERTLNSGRRCLEGRVQPHRGDA